MTKIKKVPVGTLEKIANTSFENVVTISWFGIDVVVKKTIGLNDMLEFVNNVVMSCFDDEGNYLPEVFTFAVNNNILTKYTNLTLPENLERRYELIYRTDIIDAVGCNIDEAQLHEMVAAAKRKIDHMCNTDVVTIRRKLTELISAFNAFSEQSQNIFSGVTAEDVSKLVGAVTGGSFDENKLVQAYIDHMRQSTTNGTGADS